MAGLLQASPVTRSYPHLVNVGRIGFAPNIARRLSRCGALVMCRDSVRSEVLSPDQRRKAIIVDGDCGATEADTVVELRRNRPFFAGQSVAFAASGIQPLRVAWHGNERLEVISPTCDSSTVQIQNWKGITVTCKTQ